MYRSAAYAFVWIFMLPVIPIVVFYILFNQYNYFELQDNIKNITATGPIAVYIFLVPMAYRIFRQLSLMTKINTALNKKLKGKWKFTATSSHGTAREGTCHFKESFGNLVCSGSFMEGENAVGSWVTETIFIKENVINIFYTLKEHKAGRLNVMQGLNVLYFDSANEEKMSGTWQVVGEDNQNGSIKYERIK